MRVILDGPAEGGFNMAKDQHLLAEAEEPTLRLYGWDRPTVSLGYAQSWSGKNCPLPVVRRPSGGRALVHTPHEITYAVVWPRCSLPVGEAFAEITRQLQTALNRCGIPVLAAPARHIERNSRRAGRVPAGAPTDEAGAADRPSNRVSCMNLTQPGELQLNGRKLIGSAQVRRGNRLLQHGAIALRIDLPLVRSALPDHPEMLGLEQLGYTLTPETLAQAWSA